MPIVFVHGVNNRDGPEYRRGVAARTAFLRAIVAPTLSVRPGVVGFFNPYWGNEGVRFRWEQASLPEPGGPYESFGAAHDADELALVQSLPELAKHANKNIADIARASLLEATDLVWTAAMAKASDPAVLAALAESYLKAVEFARPGYVPNWLAQATAGNFVDQLVHDIQQSAVSPAAGGARTGYESFGLAEFMDELREAASRLTNVLGDMSGDLAVAVGRRAAHVGVSVFVGDVFEYLNRRGDRSQPGVIPSVVMDAFRDALDARTAEDPNLIVIGHSLGGVISYDVLTHFATDIKVDVFVTVGAQVALFEEMKLYKESRENRPAHPPQDHLPKPGNIKRWLNVFDTSDIFAFCVKGVIDGAHDYFYDTGYGIVGAHSGYFERPSFYWRFAARLVEADA